MGHKFLYRLTHHRNKYIYVCCRVRGCPWKLRYKFAEDENYHLSLSHLMHNHSGNHSVRKTIIHHFIKDLPQGITMKDAKVLALKELRVNSSSFYYYFKKYRYEKACLKDMLRNYDRLNYEISTLPYELEPTVLPNLLMISTPQMKSNF